MCDVTFKSRLIRIAHWDRCHRIAENMTCDICGKTYDTRERLRTHSRVHDQSNYCTCDVCGRSFTSRNLLRRHSKWHVRIPEESCPICDEKFMYKGSMSQLGAKCPTF